MHNIFFYSQSVFKRNDLELEWGFFESLYPKVEVACNLVDVWSLVLNHEELKRDKLNGNGNLYCHTSMLVSYTIYSI